MYTPPVTPWESEMPEARELTPYTDEPRWLWNPARDSITSIKDTSRKDAEGVREGRRFIRIRGEQRSKAGLVTGVKS